MSAEEKGLFARHGAHQRVARFKGMEGGVEEIEREKKKRMATTDSLVCKSLFCLGFLKFLQLGLLFALCQVVVEEDEQREAVGQQNLHRECWLFLQPQEVISGLRQQ